MAIHGHVLHNGQILPAEKAVFRAGQIGILAGWGVFTTLRVSRGALFAWERHWARMAMDAALLNLTMPDAAAVEADLLRLLAANAQTDCTLRLAIVRNSTGMWQDAQSSVCPVDVAAMTATSKNWPESVTLGIQPNARFAANEFAGAKVLSWAQNLTWAERAAQAGNDEVVLLNEHGRVAECTSANIFAVIGGTVYTPPLSEGCLGGITRQVLLELSGNGISVEEKTLTPDDLYRADGMFITSTTRGLLPVRQVGGRDLRRADAAVSLLTARFDAFVDADITARLLPKSVNAS